MKHPVDENNILTTLIIVGGGITFFNEVVIGNKKKKKVEIRSLQHSMANFYREFPQLRFTELQLKMRLAGLHLQLKRVSHEQNTRLAVSSQVQRGSVADK